MSLLQTPPADRQPILTFVGEDDERVSTEAIRRELLRDGQVFWVHNRVQSIEQRAQELRELVPEARIAVAHGQMDEGRLDDGGHRRRVHQTRHRGAAAGADVGGGARQSAGGRQAAEGGAANVGNALHSAGGGTSRQEG